MIPSIPRLRRVGTALAAPLLATGGAPAGSFSAAHLAVAPDQGRGTCGLSRTASPAAPHRVASNRRNR
jgi:hypothetical protein